MKTDVALDIHNVDPALDRIEFLNQNPTGLPPHQLKLQVNIRVMLLQNFNPSQGLLNGTCLLIKTLGRRVIQAKIMTGTHAGHIEFIPRIALTTTKDCHLPFTLTRRQFPIQPSYAMTINKSQDQTLTKVGIYLSQSVFTHGQLCVAMSRVKSYNGLQFAMAPPSENSLTITSYTTNVVFKSALML